ncbi:MAG: peptidoglycan DD-metalloendopeptidase family protein [Negativicutes bacterium]|nr:peptidoglycan DD-metalloendopeptidase family protein [Negativicutes bacterium]
MYGKKHMMALALSAVLTVTAVGPVLASELEDRLNNIQQQMQVQQNQAAQAQQQVDSVSGQLRKIQTELDSAQNEYKVIQNQLDNTEQQIEMNTVILEKAEKDLAKRSKILNKRLRDIYENGQVNYLDVLFGARDFGDFTTRMELLKRVIKQDTTLIAQVKAERELIVDKRAALERDRKSILELKQAAAANKRLVETRKRDREKVLDQAVSDRDVAERAYQELQENSRQIEQMIRSQERRGGSIQGSGAMIWPASGPITSEYGWRTHPIFGTQRYHSGMDIGADYGDTVAAADNGVVIYSAWMGGYGNAVIIDHGNGISTLYAHNSELLVGEGQQIRKGQAIARVGSTGYSTGPHLHFEVRQNGSPVDPMGYL